MTSANATKIKNRPTLAVWKFASCDGCQLSLLDCEAEILAVADAIDIAWFPEASSAMRAGPYDLSLVEGSISAPEHIALIKTIRAQSRRLVTIGACATAGGIQALRNFADADEYAAYVYPSPQFLSSLATSTAIADHVDVDFELRGCPINKQQLLEVINAFVNDRRPAVAAHSVCVECKRAGHVCVMVAHGTPCLGPVTHGGCGALCPGYDRGCYGCYGPKENPTASLLIPLRQLGASSNSLQRLYSTFNAWAPEFRQENEKIFALTPAPLPRGEGNNLFNGVCSMWSDSIDLFSPLPAGEGLGVRATSKSIESDSIEEGSSDDD